MKHKPVKQSSFFKIKEERIERIRRICPRCGDGHFMAEHKQEDGKVRYYCGKCQMSIWE